jgi:predicted patatin/cPLA2 family phospholipase
MKKGLVMEGGAMRGMFTAGVIDVMMENQIVYDGAIGVSAGAVFGCNYKSGQPWRVIRYNTAYCNKPNYAGFRSWVHTGNIYGEQFCYHDVPDHLDPFDFEEYRRNPMEFYIVATDINTGEPVYKRVDVCDKKALLWLRASASIPLVSKIVCVDGYELLDGGISDAVPLQYMQERGYDRNVVILTRPDDYVKTRTRVMPIAKVVLRNYPNMIEAMENRHMRYNENIAYIRKEEQKGDTFVIRPPKAIETGSVERDRQRLLDAYYMGRETMTAQLDRLKEFLLKENDR